MTALGGVLLAATARSDRWPAGTAVRAPSGGSRIAQRAAWTGTPAFVAYAAMKLFRAFGGTFAGTTGEEVLAISQRNGASGIFLTLESWGLDPTALSAALGVYGVALAITARSYWPRTRPTCPLAEAAWTYRRIRCVRKTCR